MTNQPKEKFYLSLKMTPKFWKPSKKSSESNGGENE